MGIGLGVPPPYLLVFPGNVVNRAGSFGTPTLVPPPYLMEFLINEVGRAGVVGTLALPIGFSWDCGKWGGFLWYPHPACFFP